MGIKLQITLLGDGNVGKTSMLVRFVDKKFNAETLPTTCNEQEKQHEVNGVLYGLHLNDTSGQDASDEIRNLRYTKTDAFIVCFDLSRRSTFENVAEKWAPDVKRFCGNVPIILVGNKYDLRHEVEPREVEYMKKKIKASRYVECSAKTGMNISDVFTFATVAHLNHTADSGKCKCICRRCTIQ